MLSCLNDGRGAPSQVQRAAARRWLRALCVGLSCAAFWPAHAELLPLWEAGGGASALNLRDYRGSEQSHRYLLPVPWFVYRGEVFKADRDGVRARVLDSDRVDLDFSLNGSVPVRSSDNRARSGMPDLNPTLEIGPVLNVTLWRLGDDRGSGTKLDFRLPVRVGMTTRDGRPRDVGIIAAPNLNLDLKLPTAAPAAERWNVGVVLGALAGSRRQHAYFYDVEPQYASPARPAYQAAGGAAGWQAIVGVSRRMGRWWFGGFAKYDDLRGAVFADSPLVTARSHVSGGIALTYVFAESSRRVEAHY